MSDSNQTLAALRRLNTRFDQQGDQINNFMEQHAHGEQSDPALFTKLLEQRAHTNEAMQAQFKLYEKPLKTVLNETK